MTALGQGAAQTDEFLFGFGFKQHVLPGAGQGAIGKMRIASGNANSPRPGGAC